MIKNIYLALLVSYIFSYQGELISYDFIESFDKDEIQMILDNEFGNLAPDAIYNVSMYKVVYNTIDPYGNEVIASGVIGYPENLNQAFPMISWQHGTEVRRENVSSNNGFNILSLWLTTRGYIFLEPDYLGLGESELLHPYCMKDPSAWTTIDLIRSAKTFFNNEDENIFYPITSNNDLILFGYSEGGYVSMAAHYILENQNINEFNLIASFPMAGPYDLSGIMVDLMLTQEPYGEPYYLPYVLVPYINYYELGALSEYFLPDYAEMFEYLFNGEYSGSYINSIMPEIPIEVLLPSVIEDFTNDTSHPLRLKLFENNLWDWSPNADMYLFHGLGDELIPYENSELAYNSFINSGSENVYLYLAPEEYGGHSEVAQYCLISAYQICEDNYKSILSKGDLNKDQIFNIQDILIIIDLILHEENNNDLLLWVSDINNDQEISVLDVILLTSLILEANNE
tara:strand:+ start:691 stop:2058 length:1368 start_codon:yes stop_codon:yes gene_type:complete